ncbi:HTH-type transcriptional regulator HdfR [Paraburkholderia phenoliruptrix]|uniref:HTH lysR-type domain-containing protein n=2 Tax=Paraburkholderia phenoliruptrix TaxID=252970 RepID=K0E093_9BURK|nr:hypothetical protein BUPH_04728 [Paraburkholderia phenoliruptrix BR3459a]CAB4052954.1 HTH-type transcriptional regulator HdfR [Paraburkholderia phenoliruptrix]
MIPDLDGTLLRTFVTVVEAGSVSNAAMALHLTQAAVSMPLRRLEDEVGRRLLERSPHDMKPTSAGSVLLPYAHPLVRLLHVGHEPIPNHVGDRIRMSKRCCNGIGIFQ